MDRLEFVLAILNFNFPSITVSLEARSIFIMYPKKDCFHLLICAQSTMLELINNCLFTLSVCISRKQLLNDLYL